MGKVAITILESGEDADAPMDGRVGRAERFLVADQDTGEALQIVDNDARGELPLGIDDFSVPMVVAARAVERLLGLPGAAQAVDG